MIPERAVLCTVKHFQQRSRRIASIIIAQLIHLVEHHQRIHGTALDQGVDNAAGHGSHIGFAVAANLSFIPHAAQRQARKLAVHRLRYRNSNGGLAHTGRAHQTQNLSLRIRMDLPHG